MASADATGAESERRRRSGGRYRDQVPPRPASTIHNRRARHDYLVLDSYECGIMLKGAEVKSIREGKATLREAYARVQNNEVFLHGMHVAPYSFSNGEELDPLRPRKLLLHHRQIDELSRATAEKGVTLVPLQLYFKDGRAKVELAVARGKRTYDKRQAIAARDAKREAERALKGARE
jgi:SsrA-binding protein